jgi:hypothetical protein
VRRFDVNARLATRAGIWKIINEFIVDHSLAATSPG